MASPICSPGILGSRSPAKARMSLKKERRILPLKHEFSAERVASLLKQAEVGVPAAKLIRKPGISERLHSRS
jgi:hypothetical protein